MTHYAPEDDREAAAMLQQVLGRLEELEQQNTAETTPNVLRTVDESVSANDAATVTTAAATTFVWNQTSWDAGRTWE